METSEVLQFIVALFLAGLGVFLGASIVYAYALIAVAFALLVAMAIRKLRTVYPKIFYEQPRVFEAVSRIYETASKGGGRLVATHVRPKLLTPAKDVAVEYLKKVERPLEYKRFIFVEDKKIEDDWVKGTLLSLDSKVQRSIYFIKRSLVMPNLLWSIMPRANILLYNKGNSYTCFLGLDQLQTEDEHYRYYNFAVELHSEKVFEVLYRYFESLVASPYVTNIKSITQYPPSPDELLIEADTQSILTDLMITGSSCDEILHQGIFGRLALCLNGMERLADRKEHESDIDVMLIAKPGCVGGVKQTISERFKGNRRIQVVWGDDPQYFYFFRNPESVTVDVEVHERGTQFYAEHPLLGCSIFAYYYALFSKSGAFLHDLLPIPYGYHSKNDRMRILLDDRKGLREFQKRLNSDSPEIDPRRIVSLCVKNVAWAISGSRPRNTRLALDFLSEHWMQCFPRTSITDIRELLDANTNDVRNSYRKYRGLSERIVGDAVALCEQRLHRSVRMRR